MSRGTGARARERGLVVRELAGEVVVYDEERHRAFCLNPTAAFVWKACDGRTPAAAIAAALPGAEDARVAAAAVDVALEKLARARLLEEGAPVAVRSRREALATLGGVGAALLPIVASLAVPPAAAAIT